MPKLPERRGPGQGAPGSSLARRPDGAAECFAHSAEPSCWDLFGVVVFSVMFALSGLFGLFKLFGLFGSSRFDCLNLFLGLFGLSCLSVLLWT